MRQAIVLIGQSEKLQSQRCDLHPRSDVARKHLKAGATLNKAFKKNQRTYWAEIAEAPRPSWAALEKRNWPVNV
jgi:hypothetical protein